MNIEPYVPIEELAKHFTVSVSTVRAWVRQDLIPKHTYIKVGTTYRFNVSKVIEALTVPAPQTAQETSASAPAEDETPVQLELDFNNPDEDA
jgi:excisionase family DNA binding protein